MTEEETPDVHALLRTSPKGGPFIGTCMKCGKQGLSSSQMWEACANPGGMTNDQTLIDAIKGDDQ